MSRAMLAKLRYLPQDDIIFTDSMCYCRRIKFIYSPIQSILRSNQNIIFEIG